MNGFNFFLLLILCTSCAATALPELGDCQKEYQVYTVRAGEFAARPLRIYTRQHRARGSWQIKLLEGWDYTLSENASQWLKICGDSFSKDFSDVSGNDNAVMLAARNYKGRLQITPVYNTNGQGMWPEIADDPDWPILNLQGNELIIFRYEQVSDNRVSVEIKAGELIAYHSYEVAVLDNGLLREINFYAGGSVPAAQDISLKKRRMCE